MTINGDYSQISSGNINAKFNALLKEKGIKADSNSLFVQLKTVPNVHQFVADKLHNDYMETLAGKSNPISFNTVTDAVKAKWEAIQQNGGIQYSTLGSDEIFNEHMNDASALGLAGNQAESHSASWTNGDTLYKLVQAGLFKLNYTDFMG